MLNKIGKEDFLLYTQTQNSFPNLMDLIKVMVKKHSFLAIQLDLCKDKKPAAVNFLCVYMEWT